MVESNLEKLADALVNFSLSTVEGQLSGAYRCSIEQKNVTILKNFKKIYPILCIQYLNTVYTTLIIKDNDDIVREFNNFKKFSSHSEVCLIHIIKLLCETGVDLLDFEKINFLNHEKFVESCHIQLETIKIAVKKILPKCLSHECKGIDISTCNPNEKLFEVKFDNQHKN